MANETKLEGGCACGAIRYRLLSAPMFVQGCHCRDCQRISGSPFVVNVWIEAEQLEQTRGPAPVLRRFTAGSGKPHEVAACAECGTPLWSNYHAAPSSRFVRAATLDTPEAAPPAAHIFTRSKASWLALPEGIPAFESFYDLKELWPEASLQRIRALFSAAQG